MSARLFSYRPWIRLTSGISIVAVGCLLLCLFLASGLQAQEAPAPAPTLVVRLGVLTDNFPYSYLDESGRLAGFSWELTQALSEVTGIQFVVTKGDTAAITRLFETGQLDVLQSLAYDPKRERGHLFSKPYLAMSQAILVRSDDHSISRLSDLRGKRVLVHEGSRGEMLLRGSGLGESVVYADSVEQAIRLVNAGGADATLSTRLTALSTITRFKLRNLRLVDFGGEVPLSQAKVDYCYAMPLGYEELQARIDEGIAALRSTKRYDEIYNRWFAHYEDHRITPTQAAYLLLGAVLLGILLSLAYAFFRERRLKLAISAQADRLRVSEALYRGVFMGTHEGLLLLSRLPGDPGDLRIEQANPATLRLLRLTPGAVHQGLRALLPGREAFVDRLLGLLHAELPEEAFEFDLSIEGEPLWTRISVELVGAWLLVVISDLTAARAALEQQRRHEQQLRQAQKLEAIGTLASGIAHDFNNILTGVIGNAELGLLDLPPDSPIRANLKEILTGSTRAKLLVRQILTFSRRTDSRRELVDLGQLVDEALGFLRATTPSSIEIRHVCPPELPRVQGDPTQLHQVFMNLCTNAVQAMAGRNGLLEVVQELVSVGPELIAAHPRLRPGPHLRIGVRDTGCGMSSEVLQRIFEPFFTTKAPGEGTGLGLAVVHGIIEAHGGVLTVYSNLGQGTAFHLYLPVSQAELGAGHPVATSRPPFDLVVQQGGGECVLFVDDEKAIVRTVEMMLEHLGYRPACFDSVEVALAAFEREPDAYAAVVSDLTMPRLGGLDFVARVRALRPEKPFVLCSGFVGEAERHLAQERQVDVLLAKPLTLAALGSALARLLRRPIAS